MMYSWTKVHWILVGIFMVVAVLEYSTPPPYVFGYLYVGAILLASSQLGRTTTLWVTGFAVGLTLLNLWIPSWEPIAPVTLANRSLTMLALMVTSGLSDRVQQYESMMLKQQIKIANEIQMAKIREDLIATLTHDLKTPLLGAIETLNAFQSDQFGTINPMQKRVIATMMRSHQLTLKLVQTLMDVYRNDMEGLLLHLSPTNLMTIAEETILQLTSLATSRQVLLSLRQGDSDFRQAYWVNADSFQLQRVFNNLVTNAINHSLRGSKVELVLTRKHDHCQVQILDEGQGIEPSELSHLFERFYQGDSDRQAKGTGLGLYLSRQIIEAHGGKIWAESRSPRGAMFAFCLRCIHPPRP